MAEHKHGSMDISDQEKTFSGFVDMVTTIATIIVVILVLMALING